MSEGKFWICVWAIVLVGFSVVVGGITVEGMQANELYYRAQSECVAKGATWIPTANNGNICQAGAK